MDRDERPALRFQRPSLPSGEEIERYLALAREEGWFSNAGPCWRLLRDRLAERVDAFCVPVASGTLGLMAAVAAVLGQPRRPSAGREVLVPSFTFPATVQAAAWAGLTPRFLDIDAGHWHLDPEHLEEELRTRGDDVALVLAVSSFGTPPPPDVRRRWERACRSAGVPLIVDSAAGFGAVAEDGVAVGAQAPVEVVSFHATKPFAVGEGGAVFTRDVAVRDRVERMINFGLGPDRRVSLAGGFNGKMSELHAATGLAVLDGFDAVLESRRSLAERLRRRVGQGVSWQEGCERSIWQFVPVAFGHALERAAAERRCRGRIEVRAYYAPLHRMRPFRDRPVAGRGLERTDDLSARLLCLPMANDLTPDELEQIAAAIGGRPRSRAPVGPPGA
jgi:dTDP-4-amino-4,6-dideoxygalactose transaminase